MTAFTQTLAKYAGTSFARQLALADVLGGRPWSVDMDAGEIRFAADLKFPIQILGSHSFQDDTWLWGWANSASNLPQSLLQGVGAVRRAGEDLGVSELVEPKFHLGSITDHMVAMLCAGLVKDSAYYRAPYGQGALFVLLGGLPVEVLARVSGPRVTTVVTELISQFDLDHRQMVKSFLDQQEFEIVDDQARLTAVRADAHVQVEFDKAGRLTNISGTLNPVEKRPWWKVW